MNLAIEFIQPEASNGMSVRWIRW